MAWRDIGGDDTVRLRCGQDGWGRLGTGGGGGTDTTDVTHWAGNTAGITLQTGFARRDTHRRDGGRGKE
jgi:hypothetical protein